MKRPPSDGPAPRAARIDETTAPFTLRDIVIALCGGLTPAADGLELMIDRIERLH